MTFQRRTGVPREWTIVNMLHWKILHKWEFWESIDPLYLMPLILIINMGLNAHILIRLYHIQWCYIIFLFGLWSWHNKKLTGILDLINLAFFFIQIYSAKCFLLSWLGDYWILFYVMNIRLLFLEWWSDNSLLSSHNANMIFIAHSYATIKNFLKKTLHKELDNIFSNCHFVSILNTTDHNNLGVFQNLQSFLFDI